MTGKSSLTAMRTVPLKSGRKVPVLGQGTWGMGVDATKRRAEINALRLGVDLGMTLIDTAEMYGDGSTEELVGEAIGNRRKEVYLVSKVLPENATRRGTIAACEASLQRLKTDRLDLYLLHWKGAVPIEETLAAFQQLKQEGKILDYGVSNYDLNDMEDANETWGGKEIVTNQVLYNLMRRGIEWDLIPWCEAHKMPIMAYSPIEQGKLLVHPTIQKIAERHHATPAQIALAWVLQHKWMIAIPKSGHVDHVVENRNALEIKLHNKDLTELDDAFPPPQKKKPLELI